MKPTAKILFALLMFAGLPGLKAQQTDKIFSIENGNMYLRISLKWDAAQRQRVAINFDIDSLAIENACKGDSEVVSQKSLWKVRKVGSDAIEIYKALDNSIIGKLNTNDVLIIDDKWLNTQATAAPSVASCGINKLRYANVFSYNHGVATFFLPSYTKAGKVYLSGSFNNWSTLSTPMTKVDSGWIVQLKLLPGKYTYKYIIDGKWSEDPNNFNKEWDQKGWNNSAIYCPNYEFYLEGRPNARKVFLAGSFNNWNDKSFAMLKGKKGWYLPIYLSEGIHAYKFIVDGEWMTDPKNPDVRDDGQGNQNSFIGVGEAYTFNLQGFTSAHKVVLSGSFNNWRTNEVLMQKNDSGWTAQYILAPGVYQYKFIVDNNWILDPNNPKTSETEGMRNSVLIVKPNYTFTLSKYLNAKKVCVSGSFNGWSENGYQMYKQDGRWVLPVYLSPGKQLYKFVVDGRWRTDPDNKLWEENEYGTGNSVLWIGQ